MKKWFKYFFLSFFSHETSRGGVKRGYTNVFLGFFLALVFIWSGFTCGDMLPFGVHYDNSPDLKATLHSVFANADIDKRIEAEIEKGDLKLKKQGSEYTEALLVNTLENDSDRQNYSVNGFNIVVDSRHASTLAEVEAYCISNDGKERVISYEDYLTLSDVARLNFDFKLRYTGNALLLDDESVESYGQYLTGLGGESKTTVEKLKSDLAEGLITKTEYNRAVYENYFVSYYPEIVSYENSSKVPLLRNYYYHEYISQGINNYVLIFDDYMTGSFETKGGTTHSFYGFYSGLDDGALVRSGASAVEADRSVDGFVKNSFRANWFLNAYAYIINIITLSPFIALMIMVAALLTYSVLRLRGVESVTSIGAMLKIVGSFTWFSGAASAIISVVIAFFVSQNVLGMIPILTFFIILVIRSIIFAVKENKLFVKQSEQQESGQTEV